MRSDPGLADWSCLGWRWCARSGEVHLWNVYYPSFCLNSRPPEDAVLPGEACPAHGWGSPYDGANRYDGIEILQGLGGWVSLVIPAAEERGWRRTARAAGVEVGPSHLASPRGGEARVSVAVRPRDLPQLLAERGSRVLSGLRVVARDEVAGHEPRSGR